MGVAAVAFPGLGATSGILGVLGGIFGLIEGQEEE
jgi:hypothetical protein